MLGILASSAKACDELSKRVGVPHKCFQINEQTDLEPFFKTEKFHTFLVSGKKLIQRLGEYGRVPKNRAVPSMRQKMLSFDGKAWFFSYDPYLTQTDHQIDVDLDLDIKLVERYEKTGKVDPAIGEYKWVKDFTDICELVEEHGTEDDPVCLSADLETVRLNPYDPEAWIVSISLSIAEGVSDVVYFNGVYDQPQKGSLLWEQINWLFNTPLVKLIGANFKYDLGWTVEKWGINTTNFKMDTTLVGSLMDENSSNSLNNHAKRYTTMGGYDDLFNTSYDKSEMHKVPKKALLSYAGGDTDAVQRVANVFRNMMAKDQMLARFYVKLLHPAVRAFENVEREGILIDLDYFYALKTELEESIADLESEALKMMSRFIKYKYHGMESDQKGGLRPKLRLSRPAIIKDYMFGPRGLNLEPKLLTGVNKEPSTAMEHLMMFQDHPKAKRFIKILKDYNSATKTLSTYVDGFLSHLCVDNRFHPSFNFFKGDWGGGKDGGTVTGRASAVGPAVQCLKGDMRVMTDKGYIPIEEIVCRYEKGERFNVLTHDGRVQPIVGVYRNGVKKVFNLSFEYGHNLTNTGNHPYLTSRGWIRADELRVGDIGYAIKRNWSWSPDTGIYQPDVSQLGSDEEQVQQSGKQGLPQVWGPWYHLMQEVAHVQEFSGGYGGETQEGDVHRTFERERELRTGELCMGYPEDSGSESQKQCGDNLQRKDQDGSGVGQGVWNISGETPLSVDRFGTEYGRSLNEGKVLECGLFKPGRLLSIVEAGECETFDITIEGSHSFVAEGMVVHNTVPKHTDWAKKLRRGYVAPPGFVIVNWDFSQGELRIAADISNEETMLKLYADGFDQHMVTGGRMLGYSISDMLEMKETNPELFKIIRQNGKAGNFGLLYGMSAKGFKDYARITYGVIMSLEEAEEKRNAFFDLYWRLPEWHEEQIAFARQNGFVRNPLGRVRHLPLIKTFDNEVRSKSERQAINSPVQSTLSDMTIYALSKVYEKYGWKVVDGEVIIPDCRFHCFTHDSLTAYVKEDQVPLWVPRVQRVMETLPLEQEFGWKPKVAFLSDAEVGNTWADLTDYKKWYAEKKNMIDFSHKG